MNVCCSWRCENCWRLDKPRCCECCLPILDKVSAERPQRPQSWVSSLRCWLDADGTGQKLPPRLLRLQSVRGGAGGHRVPRDWRAGPVRDVPRLLREVSEGEGRRGDSRLHFDFQAQRGLVRQVRGAHRLQPGEQDHSDQLRGEEISLQLLHLQGQTETRPGSR